MRIFAILILGAGVWLGIKAERFLYLDRCLDAGGQIDPRGFCKVGPADE